MNSPAQSRFCPRLIPSEIGNGRHWVGGVSKEVEWSGLSPSDTAAFALLCFIFHQKQSKVQSSLWLAADEAAGAAGKAAASGMTADLAAPGLPLGPAGPGLPCAVRGHSLWPRTLQTLGAPKAPGAARFIRMPRPRPFLKGVN